MTLYALTSLIIICSKGTNIPEMNFSMYIIYIYNNNIYICTQIQINYIKPDWNPSA